MRNFRCSSETAQFGELDEIWKLAKVHDALTIGDAMQNNGRLIATVPKSAADEIRIRLTEFRGHKLCDVRQFTELDTGKDRTPTKKGFAVNVKLIPDLIAALQQAELEARAAHLL